MEHVIEQSLSKFFNTLSNFFPKLVSAILILVIGLWFIRFVLRLAHKIMRGRLIDPSVSKFLLDLLKWTLYISLFIMVVSKLGVPTTSFVAIVGAAGLAVGMALQGSLANFAGGVLILLFKPFKVGDYISAQGIVGVVQEIKIFTTSLRTDGNQMAIIPNGQLSNEKLINYSAYQSRADSLEFTLNSQMDYKKVKEAILNLALDNSGVLNNERHQPEVVITDFNDSTVKIQLQYSTPTNRYWKTHWELMESIKDLIDGMR